MSDVWWFDVEESPRHWVWRRIDSSTGAVLAESTGHFLYYIDVFRDAQAHGFTGTPHFGQPKQQHLVQDAI